MDIEVRVFNIDDAKITSEIICRNFLEVNAKDYDIEPMKEFCRFNTPEKLIEKSKERHIYVATMNDEVVGTGAIGREKEDGVSMIHSVFILPELQGRGIGREVLDALENDEIFKSSRVIKVCASITALNFYLKMGYAHEFGEARLIDNDYYPMIKTTG
jgi:GNAT superfamily N-acetyltransferase